MPCFSCSTLWVTRSSPWVWRGRCPNPWVKRSTRKPISEREWSHCRPSLLYLYSDLFSVFTTLHRHQNTSFLKAILCLYVFTPQLCWPHTHSSPQLKDHTVCWRWQTSSPDDDPHGNHINMNIVEALCPISGPEPSFLNSPARLPWIHPSFWKCYPSAHLKYR